jgi:DNA-binding beta-propeller fold protein YncE
MDARVGAQAGQGGGIEVQRDAKGNVRGTFHLFVRRRIAMLFVTGSALLAAPGAASAATGDLTQPPGVLGCVSETGSGPCADGHALGGPWAVGVSPDGNNVYTTAFEASAVDRFVRDSPGGAIVQPPGTGGCVSEDGVGTCTSGTALAGAYALAVSADGNNVYVASFTAGTVVRLNRNPNTGALTQPAGAAGCISETGASPCADGHALGHPYGMAISPDGKSIYVTSTTDSAVARINRNPTTGAIAQPAGTAGCVSQTGAGGCAVGHGLGNVYSVGVSPDSENVYVTAQGTNSIARFNRNTTNGALNQPAGAAGCVSETAADGCADGHGLKGPTEVDMSPNGRTLYVASYFSHAVVRLNRNPTTGEIMEPIGVSGCVSETGAGACTDGHGLLGPAGIAVSPDGKNVYAGSFDGNGVARFDRNRISGAIAQPAGATGCMNQTGSEGCAAGHAFSHPKGIAVSPDGTSVYLASSTGDAVVRLKRAP